MTSITKKSGPGKPPTDIAWRLRNWTWYWLVKTILDRSDEQLDEDFLPQDCEARRRVFHRLRTIGSDPSIPRADLDGESLFDRVHASENPELRRAHAAFRSPFWSMLSNPTMSLDDYRRVIADLIVSRGWYRATPEDRMLGMTFMCDDPAFGLGEDREHVYSAMLTFLESHPSADHVALLASLFREALAEVDLEQAIVLRSSLRACTAHWVRSFELPVELARLLESLVDERLVRSIWRSPDTSVGSHKTQREFVKALVSWRLTPDPELAGPRNASFPIVRRSPRIVWLDTHRHSLKRAAVEINEARSVNYQIGDSKIPALRKHARAWQRYEVKILRQIQPPERDLRFCLPVYPGCGVRSGNRPAPYLIDGTLDDAVSRPRPMPPLAFADPMVALPLKVKPIKKAKLSSSNTQKKGNQPTK